MDLLDSVKLPKYVYEHVMLILSADHVTLNSTAWAEHDNAVEEPL